MSDRAKRVDVVHEADGASTGADATTATAADTTDDASMGAATDTTDDASRADTTAPVEMPWWAAFGPVGGVVLILLGVGGALFLFLGGFDVEGHLMLLHGAAKLVAVGLVVVGTTLLARGRGVGGSDDGADDAVETDGP